MGIGEEGTGMVATTAIPESTATTLEPLLVTARLEAGVVSVDGWLSLDGLLAASWMQRHEPDRYYNQRHSIPELLNPPLPLARRGEGDAWYWAASLAAYDLAGEEMAHAHKRFDMEQERFLDNGKKARIETKGGPYKMARVPLRVLLPVGMELRWFVVGDREGVEDLVRPMVCIGKRGGMGYGTIREWRVEPWPEDWSERCDGAPTRSLPAPYGVPWGIRPPYHDIRNQIPAVLPLPGLPQCMARMRAMQQSREDQEVARAS
jgi:CRISPR type IV-associated protein Csf3